MKDYYQVLGVNPKAKLSEIRKAQKALARKYHPDSQDERATPDADRFQEITEAWAVLKDPEKKAAYDRERQQAHTIEVRQRGQSAWDTAFNFGEIFGTDQQGGFGWGQPQAEDYFLFPENDLGLLHALILAYQAKADGKWEVKKAPTDTRDFMSEAVWRVKREGSRIHIFRQVNDWRTQLSRGKPIEVRKIGASHKVQKTYEADVFLGEYYFSGPGEKQIRRSVKVPGSLSDYLIAMKSLARKIARREMNQNREYDVFRENRIINYYTTFRTSRTRPEGSSYFGDYETGRKIPHGQLWDELMKASALVQQIEPKRAVEGQRTKTTEHPFRPQDAGGEAKG